METANTLIEAGRVENINVKLAKAGDKEAFCALIDSHRLALYRVARGILNSDFDAADAIQEAIISAYSKMGSLRRNEYFKSWLIRILINECKNILRHSSRTVSVEQVNEAAVVDTYPSDDVVSSYLDGLDAELRQVIVLYYYEDFSIKDIAGILQIPQGTVKSRLSRGRGELSKRMSVRGGSGDE